MNRSDFIRHAARSEGCVLWPGALNSRGYGCVTNGRGGSVLAHRRSYEMHVGPIPEGLTIDHLCRNKLCINPAHLEPVTVAENLARANALITHCPHGHEYTARNTYVKAGSGGRGPSRQCRECGRRRNRDARIRSKAVA